MKYVDVKKRILSLPEDDVDLGIGIGLEEITASEDKLKVTFPESYKSFLLDFGYARIGHREIHGLGKNTPKNLNIIEITLREWYMCRPDYYIPAHLVPFCPIGNGDFYCFDTNRFKEGECPIVLWAHEDIYEYQRDPSLLETTHKNFIEWLNEIIDDHLKYTNEEESR